VQQQIAARKCSLRPWVTGVVAKTKEVLRWSGGFRVALLLAAAAEHDVSLMSAANIFRALDPARYEVVLE
jgi:hypothetical protein